MRLHVEKSIKILIFMLVLAFGDFNWIELTLIGSFMNHLSNSKSNFNFRDGILIYEQSIVL